MKTLCPVLIIIFIMLLMIFSGNKVSFIIEAFKPLIYAFILAYLLDSLVRFFVSKLKVRRSQGILLACIVLIGILMLMVSIIVPKIVENINAVASFVLDKNIDIGQIVINIRGQINNQYVQFLSDRILEASESIQEQLNSILLYLSNRLLQIITNIGTSAFSIVTSFIISIYMLIEKDDLIARAKRLIYAVYDGTKATRIINIGRKANIIFKSFLNGKILDAFIVGLICTIAFTIFKVPYATLMGSIIGLFNIIPYFGPIIGSVPVVIVSFFIEPTKALTSLIIILVVQQLDANFLDPKIVGKNVGVTPFWIITAVTIGGALGGIPGMIFGVPVVVLIKTIIEENIEMRLIEKGICNFEKDKLKVINTKEKKKKK